MPFYQYVNSFEGNGVPLGLSLVSLWELFVRFYLL